MELRPGYKQSEVGEIPDDWDVVPLSRFVAIQRGHDLTAKQRRRGDVPVMGSAGENGFHDTAIKQGPGVVIGRSGASYGKAHWCEVDFWPHNTALYVKDFFENDPRFSYYVLHATDFSQHNSGGAQQSLNRNFIAGVLLARPQKPEQEHIRRCLDDVDAALAGLEQLIAKKRDLKQATMQQLLTGKKRLPGFSAAWDVKRLGELLRIRHGKGQREVEVIDGPYPILATGGQIGTASRPLYDKPSVLIGRKGTIDEPRFMDTPFWSVDTLFYSEMIDHSDAKFLFYRFTMIEWRRYNEASGVPSLNARTIENIEILAPKPDEQIAIAAVLSDMDSELAALTEQAEKTRLLKQATMQELLTGRIRLPIAENADG